MSRFADIAGCPVPVEVADLVRKVIKLTGESPVSVYRGDDPGGVRIMHAHGKHTQRELYNASPSQRAAWGVLGNPNPPGRSTHELRSDGVAFPGPVGRHLPPFQVGQDWPDSAIPAVMGAYRSLGAVPIHPYASGVEYHHIDLAHIRRPHNKILREGDHGPRVEQMTRRLKRLGYPIRDAGNVFNARVTAAVKAFQRDHHLKVDGIVGPHTWANLAAAARRKGIK